MPVRCLKTNKLKVLERTCGVHTAIVAPKRPYDGANKINNNNNNNRFAAVIFLFAICNPVISIRAPDGPLIELK